MKRPLPFSCPRGLRRDEAARYVGVGATTFDKWVEEGLMPKPKRIGSIVVWDSEALDLSFSSLDESAAGANDFDRTA